MRRLTFGCTFIVGLLAGASSLLAQALQQSGTLTPGHAVSVVTNGVLKDAGSATNSSLTSIGTTGSGPTICANSGPPSGAFNRICLSATATAGGISMTNVGGATGGFTFTLNGTAQGLATVTLPVTTDDFACFADTSGTLKDCGGGQTLLSGTVLAKTANYTAASGDCGKTITLGGSAQFTLTISAASGYASYCGFLITNLASETRSKTIAANGVTSFFLYPGQTVLITNESGTWNPGPVAGRWRLTSAVTFYIRPDGADVNDGLANSTTGAFQTANAAWSSAVRNLDLNARTDFIIKHTCASPPCTISTNGQLLAVNTSPGTFGGIASYQGDCSTPANVILSPGSAGKFADIQFTLAAGILNICGFTLQGGANVENGIYVSGGSKVNIIGGGMVFGAVNDNDMHANSTGSIFINNSYSVTGSKNAHIFVQRNSFIEYGSSYTVTLVSTPAWAVAYVRAFFSGLFAPSNQVTFVGSATGATFNVQYNAVIDNNGVGCAGFPGNSSGTAANGGLCY